MFKPQKWQEGESLFTPESSELPGAQPTAAGTAPSQLRVWAGSLSLPCSQLGAQNQHRGRCPSPCGAAGPESGWERVVLTTALPRNAST